MSIPTELNPLGVGKEKYFTITIKPGILGESLTYGFKPYWRSGGYCKIVDWGDGVSENAVSSGTTLTHTYSSPGIYKIQIEADCYRVQFGGIDTLYSSLVYNSNGNWLSLGNLTNGSYMFRDCPNAVFSFTNLPLTLTEGAYMFYNCSSAPLSLTELPLGLQGNCARMFGGCSLAQLSLTSLPSGIITATQMFSGCAVSTLPLTSLPSGLTKASGMFSGCRNATIPLTSLPDGLTESSSMFYDCRNAQLALTSLPSGLTNCNAMFYNCEIALLALTSLPNGLTDCTNMFAGCVNSTLPLTTLPDSITKARGMFGSCRNAELNLTALPSSMTTCDIMFKCTLPAKLKVDLDAVVSNAPVNGWSDITSLKEMFWYCPGVTGSRSAFLAKFPNVTNTSNTFTGTNTTV